MFSAVNICFPYLTEKEQIYLAMVMERDEVSPSMDQAKRLKQLSAERKLAENIIDLIMREEKPLERKVTLRNDKLERFFPKSYTPKQMEDVILKLLEGWQRKGRLSAPAMEKKFPSVRRKMRAYLSLIHI